MNNMRNGSGVGYSVTSSYPETVVSGDEYTFKTEIGYSTAEQNFNGRNSIYTMFFHKNGVFYLNEIYETESKPR